MIDLNATQLLLYLSALLKIFLKTCGIIDLLNLLYVVMYVYTYTFICKCECVRRKSRMFLLPNHED